MQKDKVKDPFSAFFAVLFAFVFGLLTMRACDGAPGDKIRINQAVNLTLEAAPMATAVAGTVEAHQGGE